MSVTNSKPSKASNRKGRQIIAYIPTELKTAIAEHAKSNDRTITAEIIRAIKSYLGTKD